MTTFAEFQTEDRRLVLLRGLLSAAQYSANALLLRRYSDAVGHVVGADRIEQDLTWLEQADLVGLSKAGAVTVATLTARGADVAEGRTVVPGVKRPEPGL